MHRFVSIVPIYAAMFAVSANVAFASPLSYTEGLSYAQNFDSLPNPGINPVNAANPVTIPATAGVRYKFTSIATNSVFDFSSPIDSSTGNPTASTTGGLGLGATMPGWYGGCAKAMKVGAQDGSFSGGGILSYGIASTDSAVSGNRALGLLGSNASGITYVGLALTNNTGHGLDSIDLGFAGELWRRGSDSGTPKSMGFGYTVDNASTLTVITAATSAAYHELGSLAAVPRVGQTGDEAVDGTLAANQTAFNQTGLLLADTWKSGQTLWLTWHLTNANSNGNGFAIENLSFSAVPEPSTLAFVSVGLVVFLRRRSK